MNRENFNELGCFITIYFGQDFDLIDDSDEIEPKIQVFLHTEHRAKWHGLIADIDLFMSENADPEMTFKEYFQDEFDPGLWNTSAVGFLQQVRSRICQEINSTSNLLR